MREWLSRVGFEARERLERVTITEINVWGLTHFVSELEKYFGDVTSAGGGLYRMTRLLWEIGCSTYSRCVQGKIKGHLREAPFTEDQSTKMRCHPERPSSGSRVASRRLDAPAKPDLQSYQ